MFDYGFFRPITTAMTKTRLSDRFHCHLLRPADCFVLVSTSEVFFFNHLRSPPTIDTEPIASTAHEGTIETSRHGPPPPPLPPPLLTHVRPPAAQSSDKPKRPSVPSMGPHGAFLVELVTYNGHPYKDL